MDVDHIHTNLTLHFTTVSQLSSTIVRRHRNHNVVWRIKPSFIQPGRSLLGPPLRVTATLKCPSWAEFLDLSSSCTSRLRRHTGCGLSSAQPVFWRPLPVSRSSRPRTVRGRCSLFLHLPIFQTLSDGECSLRNPSSIFSVVSVGHEKRLTRQSNQASSLSLQKTCYTNIIND